MRTGREWMYNSRFVIVEGCKEYNPAFIDRVVSFVEFSCQQPTTDRDNNLLRCPCSSCKNRAYKSTDDIKVHVVMKGFVKNYYQWTSHGEPEVGSSSVQPNCNTSSNGDNEGPNPYRNIILEAAGHDFNPNSHENVFQPQPPNPKTKRLYELLHQADEPLWPGFLEDALPPHSYIGEDGVMSHLSDAEAWKHFDQTYPPLIEETRNVRLGLCTEGFQPFGQSGKKYSCWPVITINDFPAYGMLSEWSTAGKKACPYCMENSKAFSLSNGGKVSWFDCHRQFLPEDHPFRWNPFRWNKNDFIKNRAKLSQSPLTLTGEQVIKQIDEFELKEVTEIGGAEFNASISKSCRWRKHSIFWNLPYWSTNLIRQNLDVMHIEKNIFENIFETVMDIEGKTKDNAKARDELKIYCKRKELEKNESTRKYPKACYSLGKEEKKVVCDWVAKLKFPNGPVLTNLELPEELHSIYNTFHVLNLKKCLSDKSLIIPIKELQLDDKLNFVEEPVEVMDREIKQLKRSRIPIIKVRWNSKRGTQLREMIRNLFKNASMNEDEGILLSEHLPSDQRAQRMRTGVYLQLVQPLEMEVVELENLQFLSSFLLEIEPLSHDRLTSGDKSLDLSAFKLSRLFFRLLSSKSSSYWISYGVVNPEGNLLSDCLLSDLEMLKGAQQSTSLALDRIWHSLRFDHQTYQWRRSYTQAQVPEDWDGACSGIGEGRAD
ncbi:hypothetical protein Tco_0327243 [Tanacetum coccineum]